MTFEGFPEAGLDFYDDLELDNTKSFWEAHKDVYKSAVAEPMKALTAALEPEFGAAKIFRPYRDVRFAKDKSPYKTHQGAYVGTGPSTGYYVQIGAAGVFVGAGFYEASAARLAVIREAMADEAHGNQLREILAARESDGWKVGGESLKTAPRGYDVDHPRIELLRHKSLTVGIEYGFDPIIHSPALVDRVRDDWRKATPFLEWVAAHGTA
jgi:uncharacterized protein (TIGR02453 family)